MNEGPAGFLSGSAGLIIDTNLLVLFVVGTVNRGRITSFKRTTKYSGEDFDLLLRIMMPLEKHLFTVAQIMAEVSNLTDLSGSERIRARHVLKETLAVLQEPAVSSVKAAESGEYEALGLTDAAIAAVARQHDCAVLTDDLDLYLTLNRNGVSSFNFAHIQAGAWGV